MVRLCSIFLFLAGHCGFHTMKTYDRNFFVQLLLNFLLSTTPESLSFNNIMCDFIFLNFFRCSILKACFTAVFPSLIRVQQQNQLVPNKLITSTSSLHMPSLVQDQEYSSSISPLSSGQCTPTLDGGFSRF